MKLLEFKDWMKDVCDFKQRTISNRISNCKKVESIYGDLELQYEKDRCEQLISELTYSTEDEKENITPKHKIAIDGNVKNGSDTLKLSVKLYVEFEDELFALDTEDIPDGYEIFLDTNQINEKAEYSGTLYDFNKFVGPFLRNVIQTSIAKPYRTKIGKCEVCGTKSNLQAAHRHEKNRLQLIKEALAPYLAMDSIVNADLEIVVGRFRVSHEPVNETFYVLCRKCHNAYDKEKGGVSIDDLKVENEIKKVESRVNKWFASEEQNNTKLLINYLKLDEEGQPVLKSELEQKCSEQFDFNSTLNLMSKINTNNYGKVFEIKDDVIELWAEVKDKIIKEYNKFKNE